MVGEACRGVQCSLQNGCNRSLSLWIHWVKMVAYTRLCSLAGNFDGLPAIQFGQHLRGNSFCTVCGYRLLTPNQPKESFILGIRLDIRLGKLFCGRRSGFIDFRYPIRYPIRQIVSNTHFVITAKLPKKRHVWRHFTKSIVSQAIPTPGIIQQETQWSPPTAPSASLRSRSSLA